MDLVLFVCRHNAGRSQMAQAFFERLAPSNVRAESAGTEPGERIWPEVVEVMREAGLEIGARGPKELTRELQEHADLAVTMGCGDACPYVPTTVVDWAIPDPAGKPIDQVRAIRDTVEAHVRALIAERFEGVGGDGTAVRDAR